jgi:hypothetical protein
MVSTRAEYNHDVGRMTELELEVTQHHRAKDKFDFQFDKAMYPRQMHSTKAPRYRHSRPNSLPFSSIGNTGRGTAPDAHILRGIGVKADFSTANPTSAIDTGECEEHHHQRKPRGRGHEEACREANHLRHEREPSDTADSKR